VTYFRSQHTVAEDDKAIRNMKSNLHMDNIWIPASVISVLVTYFLSQITAQQMDI
jgi:hypothetical protein